MAPGAKISTPLFRSRSVLIDAGPIIAIFSQRDQWHEACSAAIGNLSLPYFTCWPVIAEAAYRLQAYPEQVRKMLDTIPAGFLHILPLDEEDIEPVKAIHAKYEDCDLQFADACLMHLANREQIQTVFTTDETDFSIFRMQDGEPLTLVPLDKR